MEKIDKNLSKRAQAILDSLIKFNETGELSFGYKPVAVKGVK